MRARAIEGLDPDGRLDENLGRTLAVRAGEMLAFMPRAGDPAEVEALHDLRIAAKRLRYVLEIAAGVEGPAAAEAKAAAKRVKELQDLVGEIHDCDVTIPRIHALREGLAPGDPARVGLETLERRLADRRMSLFGEFLVNWPGIEGDPPVPSGVTPR